MKLKEFEEILDDFIIRLITKTNSLSKSEDRHHIIKKIME